MKKFINESTFRAISYSSEISNSVIYTSSALALQLYDKNVVIVLFSSGLFVRPLKL